MTPSDTRSLADTLDLGISRMRAAGCSGTVAVSGSDGWEVLVREGKPEVVTSITGRIVQTTVYLGDGRIGGMSTGDCSESGVQQAVATAAGLAQVGDPDAWSQITPLEECGLAEDPDIDDPEWAAFTPQLGIDLVIRGERAARACDPRVRLSESCRAHARRSSWMMASTTGMCVESHGTSTGMSISAIAQQGAERQAGERGTYARRWRELRSPEAVGREAGTRAFSKFGWKRTSTGAKRVILDYACASDFLSVLAGSLEGDAVVQRQTWCQDRRGSTLASPIVSVIDHPLLRRGPGSRRCDRDGVRSRPVQVISKGRLEHFLVSGYAARRIGHPYTGHQEGASNLRIQVGAAHLDDLVREARNGLLVTEFNGWGVDLTSGTFSRGISGYAIEDGRLTHPVQEATVAGNLSELWAGIRGVGNDPDLEQAISSPSLLLDGFTVAGS